MGDPFRRAFVRLRTEQRPYCEPASGVTFLTPPSFRTGIALPAGVPTRTYDVNIKLFADGAMVDDTQTAFEIVKVSFEHSATHRHHGASDGLATALIALMSGWMTSIVFRRDRD